MTVLTVTEYLCSTCRKNSHVLSSFMTYHRMSNTACTTSGTGTAYPSGALEFTLGS
jgi:hypothetical protein